VQRYGLALDGVHYYSDVLRRWIDSRGPDGSKRKRLFLIRRDPRDISVVSLMFAHNLRLKRAIAIPRRL
jgi:putative transposase